MQTCCPACKADFEVPNSLHYKVVACPECRHQFQALSDETVRLTRDFLKAEFEKRRRGSDSD